MLEPTSQEEIDREVAEYREQSGWKFEYTVADPGGLYDEAIFICTLTHNKVSFKHTFRKGCGLRRWRKRTEIKNGPVRWAVLTSNLNSLWGEHYKAGQMVNTHRFPRPDKLPPEKREHQQEAFDQYRELTEAIPPTLEEVLGALMADAELVMHGQTLKDFCQETGVDAAEAKEMYDSCMNIWQGLMRLGAVASPELN